MEKINIKQLLELLKDYIGNDTLYIAHGYFNNITFLNEYVQGVSDEIGTSQGAYAVHLDNNNSIGEACIFENCRMISDFAPAFGCGLKNNCNFELNNCELISNQYGRGAYQSNGTLGALYIHNQHNLDYNNAKHQNISIRNCIIKSKAEKTLCLYNITATNAEANIEFCNNIFASETNTSNNKNDLIYYRGFTSFDDEGIVFRKSILNYGNNIPDLN